MAKRYRFCFAWEGLIAFLLVMVPNILWGIWPPANNVLAQNAAPVAIEMMMSASQWLMVAALTLIRRKDAAKNQKRNRWFAIACGAFLLLYYVLWVAYYVGNVAPLVFLGLAAFPCVYFILFAVWKQNLPALIPAFVFTAIHVGVSYLNFIR